MKKTLTKILAFVLTLTMIVSLMVVPASGVTVAQVGALWDGYTAGSGTFTVTSSSRVFVVGTSAPTGDLLQTAQLIQRELKAEFGESYFAEMVWGDAKVAMPGDIVLNLDTASGTGADGYKLNVTGTTATVTAADTDGLIYGANNLMKCFRAVGGNSISGFTGNDTPDTKERTVHLDLARKYYTVEWVKNFIRQMSWMGYNALELHLSEDGGFRADFWDSNYYTSNYQPENNFSWLCGSKLQYWVYDPYDSDPDANKYLTTAELVEICDVAKEYHIEIIPSFDSPAHMDYITWKFEQYHTAYKNKNGDGFEFTYGDTTYNSKSSHGCINYAGKTGASSPNANYTTIDITEGTMARAFVFALYEDMADFFKEYAGSTKFNIGADEVGLSRSTTWEYAQFPEYVNSLNRMLNGKGYTVRMYNDFIGSTTYNQEYDTSEGISEYNSKYSFDSNIEICYWTSDFHPTTGKWSEPVWHVKFFWENNTGSTDNWGDGGRTMYNCIQTNTYYVLRYAHALSEHADARDPENHNWTFYGTNEADIYNNWYPADISEKGVYTEDATDVPADQLGGAYFLIWNDYAAMNTESDVWEGALDACDKDRTYYLFDIMASNIVKMWNADINSTVTYSKFAEVREATLEWFPGFTSCSAAASLPVATDPEQAADYSALRKAIDEAEMLSGDAYTSGSYADYKAAYEEAVAAAEAVIANREKQDVVSAAVTELSNALVAAEGKLVEKGDKTALQAAVDAAITEQGNYSDSTWGDYQAALKAAEDVLGDDDATQADVDAAVKALTNAEDALQEKDGQTEASENMTVEKLAKKFRANKKVALRITTDVNADEISVVSGEKSIELTLAVSVVHGNNRLWLVEFPANAVKDDWCEITALAGETSVGSASLAIEVK